MNNDKLYQFLSEQAYKTNKEKYVYYELNGKLEELEVVRDKKFMTKDTSTGFDALIVKKDDQIIVSFRGTEGSDILGSGYQDLVTDIRYIVRKHPVHKKAVDPRGEGFRTDVYYNKEKNTYYEENQFRQAEQLIKEIKKENPNTEVSVTGHSLGGALAQYVAARYKLNAVTYSAPSVVDLLDKKTKEKVMAGEFDSTVINYVHPKDSVGAGGIKPWDRHVGSTYYIGTKFEYENYNNRNRPFKRLAESINNYHDMKHYKFDKYGFLNNPIIYNVLLGTELYKSPRFASANGGLIEVNPVDVREVADKVEQVGGSIEEESRMAKAVIQSLLIDDGERHETRDIGYEILNVLIRINHITEEDFPKFVYDLRKAADDYEKADS